jgi:hypothetical protein
MTRRALAAPYWLIALVAGAIPAALTAARLARRRSDALAWRVAGRLGGNARRRVAVAPARAAARDARRAAGRRLAEHAAADRPARPGRGAVLTEAHLFAAGGRLGIVRTEGGHANALGTSATEHYGLSKGSPVQLRPLPADRVRFAALGVTYRRSDVTRPGAPRDALLAAAAPVWMAMLLLATPLLLWLAVPVRRDRRARRRRRMNLCVACGYDLRAATGRCPECGAAVPLAPPPAGEGATPP